MCEYCRAQILNDFSLKQYRYSLILFIGYSTPLYCKVFIIYHFIKKKQNIFIKKTITKLIILINTKGGLVTFS